MRKIYLAGLLLLLCFSTGMAQKKDFTFEDLFYAGTNYKNLQPENMVVKWWGDKAVTIKDKVFYQINPSTGARTELFSTEDAKKVLKEDKLSLADMQFPYADKTIVLFQTPKAYVMLDWKKKSVVWKIERTEDPQFDDFNTVSRNLAYIQDDNLYVTTADGKTHQVSRDGSRELVYGQSVHRNEFGIMKGTFWSPKGDKLAFYQMDQSMVADYPQVNISTRIATVEPDKYPMAGETSHKVTVGVFDPATDKTVYLQAGDPTNRYFTNISWSPDEKAVYMIELNRDQNHAQLVRYNAETGEKEAVLYEETHPKYVEPLNPIVFLPWDSSAFIYQTRRDGYNHLYLFSTKQYRTVNEGVASSSYKEYTPVRQLTKGKFEVQELLGFNTEKKEVIIRSNEVNPLHSVIYAVDVQSGKRMLLSSKEGVHTGILSQGKGLYVADWYSAPDVPRSVNILQTSVAKSINLLTAKDPWTKYNVPAFKVGTLKAADGATDLYYRMTLPPDFDPKKKYPAIVYVYGGPHAHNVDARWHYMARPWDVLMASKGYIMFSIDNRGSENRGLEFENVTFRHLGTEEMKDQMQGVKYLESLPYVDAKRMGVHGWSFGGFMTTNLMLTYPDVFKVGVAGGPVIDWKYYEVMYGERYMDTPQANPEGYKESNLNLKAGNLKGRLLVIYGGNDPTCVPQHTLSFMRACIDAGTQPDLFTYPGDGHNMFGRDQIHLHQKITRYFEDFLK